MGLEPLTTREARFVWAELTCMGGAYNMWIEEIEARLLKDELEAASALGVRPEEEFKALL